MPNDAHFSFAIFEQVGYPGALIYSYIEYGCRKYPQIVDDYAWITAPLPDLCCRLHLADRTAKRSLKILAEKKLIIAKKKNGTATYYRASNASQCQNGPGDPGQNGPGDPGQNGPGDPGQNGPAFQKNPGQNGPGTQAKMAPVPKIAAANINTAPPENAPLGIIGNEPQIKVGGVKVSGGAADSPPLSDNENLIAAHESGSDSILRLLPSQETNGHLLDWKNIPPVPGEKLLLSWMGGVNKASENGKWTLQDMIDISARAIAQLKCSSESFFGLLLYARNDAQAFLQAKFWINPNWIFHSNPNEEVNYLGETWAKYNIFLNEQAKKNRRST